MTSLRQIEANRHNALRGTGPITEEGKRRSRRNAVRHGLTAETVVEGLEDTEDYRGFEAAVIASYDARNAVERELVLRLASLLWRLRRATAVETELLRRQTEIAGDSIDPDGWMRNRIPVFPRETPSIEDADAPECCNVHRESWKNRIGPLEPVNPARDLALCFVRLVNFDNGVFERLGRYESALARQVFRSLLLLKSARAR